jgi:hypothetical protein
LRKPSSIWSAGRNGQPPETWEGIRREAVTGAAAAPRVGPDFAIQKQRPHGGGFKPNRKPAQVPRLAGGLTRGPVHAGYCLTHCECLVTRATGECPEWQRGRTVNPLAYAFVGSSPTSPTNQEPEDGRSAPDDESCIVVRLPSFRCGCSSMVEQQPSKLMTRVRFPSPAPMFSST